MGVTAQSPLPQVIVLNGGCSSGKSAIARALQLILPQPWLSFGVDVLGDALPERGSNALVTFGPRGEVRVHPGYLPVERAWYRGLATIAAAGFGLILDEVFLDGVDGRTELADALTGLSVVWVGVHCDPAEAAARERARADRVIGMAAAQAVVVHRGVAYDIEVDTPTPRPPTAPTDPRPPRSRRGHSRLSGWQLEPTVERSFFYLDR